MLQLIQPFAARSIHPNHPPYDKPRRPVAWDGLGEKELMQLLYREFAKHPTALSKNSWLHQLWRDEETLFYQLVQAHLKDMLPILYTPTVGEAVKQFPKNRSSFRGLYISYEEKDKIASLLDSYQDGIIRIAVLTDGERILGLGDQGVAGIEICVAKSMLYVLFAQIPAFHILPIYIDVGTNNPELLQDANYQGLRAPRITGQAYDDFMDAVVNALHKKFPDIYLHWEDLERDNAKRLLDAYRTKLPTFNDDMQGTGVVTLASALRAVQITNVSLIEQRIVIVGGGTAGLGIADQLCDAMVRLGSSLEAARNKIWLIGRKGLLFSDSSNLTILQKPYARPARERADYHVLDDSQSVDLQMVIQQVEPTFLIGCSGQPGMFTESLIKTMAQKVERPIIFPLSNPTECCEAHPEALLRWTQYKAIIATGSPFAPVMIKERPMPIAQCNNALVFPGIALGMQISQAKQLTDHLLWEACCALCEITVELAGPLALLPDIKDIHQVTQKIASRICQVTQSTAQ